jgi:hypothetical protein
MRKYDNNNIYLTWKQHILPANTEYNVFWRNITKLGAIGFAKKDYKSRETGAITRMREDLELETLEERRPSLRLILMYKVVEGLVAQYQQIISSN